jgi:hypothetical protein
LGVSHFAVEPRDVLRTRDMPSERFRDNFLISANSVFAVHQIWHEPCWCMDAYPPFFCRLGPVNHAPSGATNQECLNGEGTVAHYEILALGRFNFRLHGNWISRAAFRARQE